MEKQKIRMYATVAILIMFLTSTMVVIGYNAISKLKTPLMDRYLIVEQYGNVYNITYRDNPDCFIQKGDVTYFYPETCQMLKEGLLNGEGDE